MFCIEINNYGSQYYLYPEGIMSFNDFIEYINNYENKFIKLRKLKEDKCTFPYFVLEEIENVSLNIEKIAMVTEKRITILSRAEYEEKLHEIVEEKCIYCQNYEDFECTQGLYGCASNISLDGKCWMFEKV